MAMTLLCGLPDQYGGLISALDAFCDDKTKFTFEFVLSRSQQEEQRHSDRYNKSVERAETAALVARKSKPKGGCVFCGNHNDSTKCWRKYPHLALKGTHIRHATEHY